MVVFQPSHVSFPASHCSGGGWQGREAEHQRVVGSSEDRVGWKVQRVGPLDHRGLLEPWNLPTCQLFQGRCPQVVICLQAVTLRKKNPWKNHHQVASKSSRQEFFRVADILKTSWLVVYPVVYDLFHTSFLVVIEMPMNLVLGSTRDSWILGNNNKLLVWII